MGTRTLTRRMQTEPVVNFEGRYYQLSQTYCEPKPLQKPTPPFVIGGVGELLTLRVVAQYADVWNFPGFPHGTVEEFQHKNRVLDGYCREAAGGATSLGKVVVCRNGSKKHLLKLRRLWYTRHRKVVAE